MPWSLMRMRYLIRWSSRPGDLGERRYMKDFLVPWNRALTIVCRLYQFVGQQGLTTGTHRMHGYLLHVEQEDSQIMKFARDKHGGA